MQFSDIKVLEMFAYHLFITFVTCHKVNVSTIIEWPKHPYSTYNTYCSPYNEQTIQYSELTGHLLGLSPLSVPPFCCVCG